MKTYGEVEAWLKTEVSDQIDARPLYYRANSSAARRVDVLQDTKPSCPLGDPARSLDQVTEEEQERAASLQLCPSALWADQPQNGPRLEGSGGPSVNCAT
jgi:hypothetical protein